MRLFITAKGKDLNAKPDERFGRGEYFQIIDSKSKEIIEAKENPFKDGAHGVGIRTSNYVIENADAVIANKFGPKAAEVLKQAGIKMYLTEGETVKEIIENFNNQKLQEFK
ncbi:MAG: dinitrogenase iron-molybdenum cofactor biosynthesis protein [Candidatus Mcinerneyibacterium aminivorans]|jgi:predicted Fe-Mo cluster-binding NifX family protein|uniref:Dinitrogenase iron-molybdenum cofactor biosynthesis protein n=1 Tax=Candidatus Mcinerneyibacterium aminivorans TaxID=2703815 RepID=A0A5D0MID8_9BACT|nr:MAG: dinitrogenase iron-molybdenum cofactor biosynthesis protein [Candidatus Mcinerneyibacterium aminivorans]